MVTIKKSPDATLKGIDINGDPYDPPFLNCLTSPGNYTIKVGYFPPAGYVLNDNSSYYIDWGDGQNTGSFTSFPTPPGLTHNYATLGLFTLTFTVTGVNGCVKTSTCQVYNGSNPASVQFNGPGNTTGCVPMDITFSISLGGNNTEGTTYTFDFGDGTNPIVYTHPLTITTITHTYTTPSCGEPGNQFIATATATNPCSSTNGTVDGIKLSKKPTAQFTLQGGNQKCVNTPVTFNNNSIAGCYIQSSLQNGTNFTWDFGDGTVPVTQNNRTSPFGTVNHTFANPGIFTVTLTATNYSTNGQNCGFSVVSQTVCISPQPVATFITDKITDCIPFTVSATNTSSTPNICNDRIYTWSVTKNGATQCAPSNQTYTLNVIGDDATVLFPDPGSYSLKLNVKNSCTAIGVTASVTIIAKSVPKSTINSIADICIGNQISPTANFQSCYDPVNEYLWTFPGGTPPSLTINPPGAVSYPATGSFNARVKAKNGCGWGNETTSNNFNVLLAPSPTITGNNIVCTGTASVTYVTEPGMSNYSWNVSSGGSITSGAGTNTITVLWTTTGLKTITLNYSRAGCTALSPTVYTVTVNPRPSPTISGLNSVCLGIPATNYFTEPGMSNYNWTISPGGSIIGGSGTGSVVVNWHSAGTRTLTLNYTNSFGCTASMTTVYPVKVNTLPAPTIIASSAACIGTIVDYSTQAGMSDYQWIVSPGGTITSGGTSSSSSVTVLWTTTGSQSLTVNYTDINGCTASVPTVYNITVNSLPSPSISGNNSVCLGATGSNYSTQAGMSAYSWSISPGGVITSGASTNVITVLWNNIGLQSVSVNYTQSGCRAATPALSTITVNSLPVVDAGADFSIPHGTNTLLAGNAGPGIYTWTSSPAGQINAGGNTLTPTTKNLFSTTTFTLSVTNAQGCLNTDNMVVSLSGSALEVTATAAPDSICVGQQSQLGCTPSGGSGIYTYLWTCTPPGSPEWTSSVQSPTVTPITSTVYSITINDGYNQANASKTLTVYPLPTQYSITPGGSYCFGGAGITVGLVNSEPGVNYTLYHNGNPTLFPISGTGSAITFGNQTVAGTYTIKGIRVATSCENTMTGTSVITIDPLPFKYSVTGGGSYPAGGTGVPVGLNGSQSGVNYRLIHDGDTLTPFPGTPGTGSQITFSNQTLAGTYTVAARNATTGCIQSMTGSVAITINPYPATFNVYGGGVRCSGDPGKTIGIDGSEIGVIYVLKRNNDSIAWLPGSGDSLNFGNFPMGGIYTVIGINISSGLILPMNGNAIITVYPIPSSYLLVPQGDTCSGTEILLNGSELGINYSLLRGSDTISTQTGTGNFGLLSFGAQFLTGTYHVVAVNPITGCNANMIGFVIIHPKPELFNINPPGILCPGHILTLSGSETGINYQLRRDSLTNVGTLLPGTGDTLSFGSHFIPGVYRVLAINPLTHCYSWQNGSSAIQPGPTVYSVVPNGDTCAGGEVRLNGSQTGIQYHLVFNNIVYLDSLYGTGYPLVFGTYLTSGLYRILAKDTLTHCERWMDGMINILNTPTAYHIIPNGIACEGSAIGLDDSETDIFYTLIRDNTIIAGGPIPGTGSAISFGIQSYPGTYEIEAQNPVTACSRLMSGTTSLFSRPFLYLVMPQGIHCPGTDIYLNGSQTGVNYQLLRNGIVQMSLWGNGTILHFGPQYIPGSYSIKAVNTISVCDTMMTGSTIILQNPLPFNITPAGAMCSPAEIGLSGSQVGITYKLLKNGVNSGTPLPGTGGSLSFGLQMEGVYRIVATNTITTCSDTMPGNAVVSPGPVVSLGNDTTICSTSSLYLVPVAFNYSTVQWISSGDGVFSNATSIITDYLPGPGDIQSGIVNLTVTVQGASLCPSNTDRDTLALSIYPKPLVVAGNDTTTCPNVPVPLSGFAANYMSLLWSSAGDGTFDNPAITNPHYTPGPNDISSGQVSLILSAGGKYECVSEHVSDTVILHFHQVPTAIMTGTSQICEGTTGTLQFNFTGMAPWNLTYGDGTAIHTVPDIQSTPYVIVINPMVNTTYSILNLHDQYCSGNPPYPVFTTTVFPVPLEFNMMVTNGGVFCQGGNGVEITIDGSQLGVLYQLLLNGDTTGAQVTGTGTALSFGWISVPGIYKIKACRPQLLCSRLFSDSVNVIVRPLPDVNFSSDSTCFGEITQFHILGTDIGKIPLWTWDFGDGTVVTYTSPVEPDHQYSNIGVFTVSLSVTDTNGCSRNVIHPVSISPLPVASFSHNAPVCQSSPVQLTDLSYSHSNSYIALWEWDFGDGQDTIIYWPGNPNLNHTYLNAGTYSVRLLVVNNENCADEKIRTIQINAAPVANFACQDSCAGQLVHFTDLSQTSGGGSVMEWNWNFGDPSSGSNNISSVPNPTHIFSQPGTYFIRLIIMTANSCFDTIIKPLVVRQPPAASFSAASACHGTPTQFLDLSVPNAASIIEWDWNFGDGSAHSNLQNPQHLYQLPGTYPVVLTVKNSNQCSHDTTIVTQVFPIPLASFSTNSPRCSGSAVTFYNFSTAPQGQIIRWHWDFGDGTDTTVTSPGTPDVIHIFPVSSLQYLVRLTVTTNESCSGFVEHTVNLLPKPVANFSYSLTTCQAIPIQFTDQTQTTGGIALASWSWNFDDPMSGSNNLSALQNPLHSFVASGTHQVTLVAENTDGCGDTISKAVFIHPRPVAKFSADTACMGGQTSFTDKSSSSTGFIVSHLWDFGDGQTSGTANPVHVYIASGYYLVHLTVTDSKGCTHDTTQQVMVNPLPVPGFTFGNPACEGTPVSFIDQSLMPSGLPGHIESWVWNWGDGSTTMITRPASPNVSHLFPSGVFSFNVQLRVISQTGCTDSLTHSVNLIPRPIPAFEVQPGSLTCAGQPVLFHDLTQSNGGGSILSWQWNFGDPTSGSNNSSSVPNPAHTFINAGVYTVTLTVTNTSGCSNIVTSQVQIFEQPLPDFSFTSGCEMTPIQFTDQSVSNQGSIISYLWNFGDGHSSSLQSPSHSYLSYGIYSVTLKIENSNGCIKSTMKSVPVAPVPIPGFSYSQPNCIGSPMNFTDQSFIPAGFSGYINKWVWNFGDNTPPVTINFPASPNISHTFTGPALSHIVRLTVTSSENCTDSMEMIVQSTQAPAANFSYSSINCTSQPVQFNDLSQPNGGANVSSWHWNFGDPSSGAANTSSDQNPQHLFSGPGTYSVTLTASSTAGCHNTTTNEITINILPQANFSNTPGCEGDVISFNNTSVPNANAIVSSSWNFGDGSTSLLPNPQHIYSNYGIYQVSLTVINSNGCSHTVTKPVTISPEPIPGFSTSSTGCLGQPVNFYDQSTVAPGFTSSINQWIWDFGDGTASITVTYPSNPNATHIFSGAATSYTVRLTVISIQGCTAFTEKLVNTFAVPLANFAFTGNLCSTDQIQFTDQSQTNGGSTLNFWSWNFDDPVSGSNNISSYQNPIHIFAAPGSYNVTLITGNINGCRDTIVKQVIINPRPVAEFSADTVCLGSLTTFTNLSSSSAGAIVNNLWEFGDGQISTAANPTHQYGSASLYSVHLTVTSSLGCIKDTMQHVLVLQKPVAQFTFQSPNCSGDSVQFTDLSGTTNGYIQQWVWNFGDGSSPVTIVFPTNPSIKHKYSNGGNYNVVLTITTTTGCEAQVTHPIQISFNPLANFSFTPGACAMAPVIFTDLSQPNGGPSILNWNWNFGDPASGINNTSTLQNPVHYFTQGGTYSVTLRIDNLNGCHDSISKTVTVNAPPTALFTANTACQESPTQFNDQSTTPSGTVIAWNWNFGDPSSGPANTSTLQNPQHIYNAIGNYQVTLQVINSNQCAKDTMIQVTVNPKPNADFQFTTSCAGELTYFTDKSIAPNSTIVSWSWDFGDGNSANIQNPSHAYQTPGTFHVKLLVMNLLDCADSITIPVEVHYKPLANFTSSGYFCPARKVAFQDSSVFYAGAHVANRLWTFEPGQISNQPNPIHYFTNANTTYPVSLIVTDDKGCSDTVNKNVFVKPSFSLDFIYNTACFGDSTLFQAVNHALGDTLYSLRWDFGDPSSGQQNTSTEWNPSHRFTQPGNHYVWLKAFNSDNCIDSIFKIVIVRPLPNVHFTSTSQPCNKKVYFHDQSSAGAGTVNEWKWTWGDISPAVVIQPPLNGDTSHLYAAENTYSVTLCVTNSYGCRDSLIKTVNVACITAAFVCTSTLNCSNEQVNFYDHSTPAEKINWWSWDFGDQTDTSYTKKASSIRHRYNPGQYNVSLSIRTYTGSDTIEAVFDTTIRIAPAALARFTADTVCRGDSTHFIDLSDSSLSAITMREWKFGDNSTMIFNDTLVNPVHNYLNNGKFQAKLIIQNSAGCMDSTIKTILVRKPPTAEFSNSDRCTRYDILFSYQPLKGDTTITKWWWNFGDPANRYDTIVQRNPKHRYDSAGAYPVFLRILDKTGCSDTIIKTVSILPSPLAAFTLSDNYQGLKGQIKLNNKSSEDARGFKWNFGNGKGSTEKNPVVLYNDDQKQYIIELITWNDSSCYDSTFREYEFIYDNLYVPNAFSPVSEDLEIREFRPKGMNLKYYHIMIFDKWGHLLWESDKITDDDKAMPADGWDGRLNGELLPQDVYMWRINATFKNGKIWEGSDSGTGSTGTMGTLTLIR